MQKKTMMFGAYYPHHISVSSLKQDKDILAARVVNLQTMLDQRINKIKVVATILCIDNIHVNFKSLWSHCCYVSIFFTEELCVCECIW